MIFFNYLFDRSKRVLIIEIIFDIIISKGTSKNMKRIQS